MNADLLRLDYPIEKVQLEKLDPAQHGVIDRLLALIPPGLRGIFFVECQGIEGNMVPTGLRLQPDPALAATNRLRARIQQAPSPTRHGNQLSRLYGGEAFARLLRDGVQAPELALLRPASADVNRTVGSNRRFYAQQGLDYVESFSLRDTLRHPDLLQADRIMLARVRDHIPANLHDVFACDLVKNPHGAGIIAQTLGLAPNLAGRQAAETVLAPVAAMHYEAQPQRSRAYPQEVLGINPHVRTMLFERPDLLKLAAALREGRARTA